jgi:OmpA family
MYILITEGLGEDPVSKPRRLTLTMRPKPHLDLNRFRFNKATLTDRLAKMVTSFADAVIRNSKTTKLITRIRLIGHTDSTGEETYNVGLGDRRAQAVEARLKARLKGLADRVMIVVKPSPGEKSPRADNRTDDGRDRNRRVEVFIETSIVTPPRPAGSKIWDFMNLTLPTDRTMTTGRSPLDPPPPPGPTGMSLQARLDEMLSGIRSRWLRDKIRNAIVSGSCAGLEALFTHAGGTLREGDKDELRQQCSNAWKKPVR